MNPGFMPGDELILKSALEPRYLVRSVLSRIQRISVLDLQERDEKLLDEAPLRVDLAAGAIRIRRAGYDLEAELHRRSQADDEGADNARRFLHKVQELMTRYGVSFHRAYEMLAKDILPKEATPELTLVSLAQAYRHWERDRKGLPLCWGSAARGNRVPRYAPEVYEVVTDLAEKHLLIAKSRWKWRSFHDLVNLRLHEANLLAKGQRVSRAFVQRVVTAKHPNPDHHRMLPRDATAPMAVAGLRIRIAAMFERVEQDGLHLPWLIRTPYGDSTNVWLVHAIDCATSMPLGWCMVIGSPRTSDSLKCIETILFPKAPNFERLGLMYDFDIFGAPMLLVMDNGPENRRERLKRLTRLSITPKWLKSREAHRKPFIERLNRSLKEYLEPLPGSTRLNGVDGGRDPAALGDPIMTLEEMERWIVRFYFEHWINKPLERLTDSVFADNEDLGSTPLRRYQVLTQEKGYPIPLPPSVNAWRSTIYDPHVRTLSRKTGISYENYQFRGDQLAHLIHVYGETSVKVLVDPDDFRWVYVVDRDGSTLVPLVNASTSEITPAYSFDEARVLLKEAGEEGVNVAYENVRRDVLNRSVERAGRAGKSATGAKTPGKAARSRQTAELARRHGAVERSSDKPLPPSTPSLGHPPITVRQDDWSNATALAVFDRLTGARRT